MVEYIARTPNTWVLSGEAAPSREWLNMGWDESEKLVYQTGLICPYAHLQYKNMATIWPYNYINNHQSLIGCQKCDNYYSVIVPGTLGISSSHLTVPRLVMDLETGISKMPWRFVFETERNH